LLLAYARHHRDALIIDVPPPVRRVQGARAGDPLDDPSACHAANRMGERVAVAARSTHAARSGAPPRSDR
jgi:hypothetical protein